MRRIPIALGLALAGAIAAVGFAAPASSAASTATIHPATTPGPPWVLYKTFGWPDACSSAGYAGEQSGQWVEYLCDEISPPSWDAPGIVDLYVVY